MIHKTHSAYCLGDFRQFEKLAKLAHLHDQWRKVARLVGNYNRILRPWSFAGMSADQRRIKAMDYLIGALVDTKLHDDIKREICATYNLTQLKQNVEFYRMLLDTVNSFNFI